ncbi:MAG TPA: tRNA (adenosine(37)-N6)-threonylcarbamoyltransferase complex ATPase subunit type 1 TsaE [Cerasibacillus sp.]|uniref:tRNA (adenosine(37)-N6)-threonylcarbamoyltransferase complex ATPase subunit type 1 TsaE n=1 Tax=Cerasibacillus sp. TaxID=2498711 RepID=UPI002F425890
MDVFKLTTYSEDDTMEIAKQLASLLDRGDVLTLEGDLGAGKTTFTKGLAKGLNIEENVSSPTFTIIKEYTDGKLPLYHMDVYRLEGSDEDIGFEEYFYGNGISIVEWAQFIEDYLPNEVLSITIHYGEEGSRIIEFAPYGPYYHSIVESLFINVKGL